MTALVVQLSDTHIVEEGQLCLGLVDTAGFLERAVDAVLALDPRPDAVLVSGDLVNEGRPAQYANLRSRRARMTTDAARAA